METDEIWRNIKEYCGLYQISNKGRVKSLAKKTSFGSRIKFHPEMILTPVIGKRGYFVVGLSQNGKTKTKTLHRLIAEAFIPNPDNKPYIDHIDGNRLNNEISNLRWVTAKENSNNPVSLERNRQSTKNLWNEGVFDNSETSTFRRVAQYDKNGNLISEWDCIKDASYALNIDSSSISAVCLGKRNTAGGFVWKHIGKRYNPRNND